MTAWVQQYFAAWSGRDVDQVLRHVTDDVVFEDVGAGHVSRGVGELRAFVEACYRRVPDASYDVVDCRVSDDSYWVEWVMHARGVEVRGASVGTLRDGRISSNRDYWNARQFTL
jgi:steroid delta-isomerase-like uncharacterized protein